MANFANLKAAINAVIKQNGHGEITGEIMNQVLTAIVNSLGDNYQFAGVATPSTNPGTPDQNVFYMATQAGTYTNFSAIVLQAGISILLWNGSWSSETFFTIDAEPTSGSNNFITSGAVFDKFKLDGGAYDVSAHNNNATFADLSAILNNENLDTLIPVVVRHGGMSIKFVQTSDNKYVQCRYMGTSTAAADFTNTANWQGVDETPTADSQNLMKSGGAYSSIKSLCFGPGIFSIDNSYIDENGNIHSIGQDYRATEYIRINNDSDIELTGFSTDIGGAICFYDENKVAIQNTYQHAFGNLTILATDISTNAAYCRLSSKGSTIDKLNIRISSLLGLNINFVKQLTEITSSLTSSIKSINIKPSLFYINGKYLIKSTGLLDNHANFSATGFIRIIKHSDIVLSGFSVDIGGTVCFYDKNQVFIENSGHDKFGNLTISASDIPDNAAYIRLSSATSTVNTLNVEFCSLLGLSEQIYDDISLISTNIGIIEQKLDQMEIIFPKAYIDTEVELQAKLVKTDLSLVNGTCRHASLTVHEGEKYKINGKSYNSDYPLYIYTKNGVVVSYYGSETQTTYNNYEITIPSSVDTLIVNGDASGDALVKVYKYQTVYINQRECFDGVAVGKDSEHYIYTDVQEAVVAASVSNLPVFIDAGTFENTVVTGRGTPKKLIGRGRDLTILTNNTGAYTTPPIEMSSGLVKDMTVAITKDGEPLESRGYCIHIDDDAGANSSLVIENCNFKSSNSNSCIGVGLRDKQEIIFRNCEFIQEGDYHCVYIHNGGGSKSYKAVVRFINCYFKAVGKCIKLQQWGSDCQVDYEFINCTLVSDEYGVTDDCLWIDNRIHTEVTEPIFQDGMTLLPTSHGNNIPVLNIDIPTLKVDEKINVLIGKVMNRPFVDRNRIPKGGYIFDASCVNVGDTISYAFTLTGTSGAIDLLDTDGNRIQYYGIGTGGTTGQQVSGTFVIPNNFGTAVVTNWKDLADVVLSFVNT